MSFIDLDGDRVWTREQIMTRANATMRQRFPKFEEFNIFRRFLAEVAPQVTVSAELQADIDEMVIRTGNLQTKVGNAISDNRKLRRAIEYEDAYRRLLWVVLGDFPGVPATVNRTDVDGNPLVVPNPQVVADTAERAAAQTTIDDILAPQLALVTTRGRLVGLVAEDPVALLADVVAYETAATRLAQPILDDDPQIPDTIDDGEGNQIPNPVIVTDYAERAVAQATVDMSSGRVRDLVSARAFT